MSLFLVLAGVFYAPLLLGLRTFPDGDFTHHFLPFSLFQQDMWRAGHLLPLWNPYTYSGHPFLADVQAAVFYPPGDLLLLLTLPFTSAAARLYFLQIEAVLHVALAGFFTYLLARDLTGSELAGLGSGVLFAFSGYLAGYPPLQLAILRSAIWLPLVLWFLRRAFLCPGQWRWWIGGSLACAMALLAGHPQTFLYISYTVAGWILLLLAGNLPVLRFQFRRAGHEAKRRPHAPTDRWMRARKGGNGPSVGQKTFLPVLQVIGVSVLILLTVGLTAAQWLPTLEFTRYSVRATVDYDFVSAGFPLRDTWQMLFPGLLTRFSPLYIGLVGLFLAPLALAYRPDGEEGAAWPEADDGGRTAYPLYFALLALLALLLAYGRHGFLFRFFYEHVPGWNLFRQQERAAYLVAFGLSMLAGYGIAALPVLGVRQRRWWSVSILLALVASGLVFWGMMGSPRDPIFMHTAGLSLALGVVLMRLLWQRRWTPALSTMVLILAFANLYWANVNVNLDPSGPLAKVAPAPEMEAVRQAVEGQDDGEIGRSGRVYNEYRLQENYGMRIGVEDVWGSSPLRIARYAALFDEFPLDRMWQLTGVNHVLTWRRELFEPSSLLAEFPQQDDTTFLHRLNDPNPLAWLVYRVEVTEDQAALALLADHAFDLETGVVLSAEEVENGTLRNADGMDSSDILDLDTGRPVQDVSPAVQVVRVAPDRLRVSLESEQGGIVVVSENWLPGWRVENVRCSGEDDTCVPASKPLRANLSFLAVPVSAGPVSFDLHYRPTSVQAGLYISVATLLLLIVAVEWKRRSLADRGAANEAATSKQQ